MKIRNLLAALGLLCLTSCATDHHEVITQPAVSQIRPGVTTEADLVHLFGPPDTRLAAYQGSTKLDWFRSVAPKPRGYFPVFGQFWGGLDFDVQQLSVSLGQSGRVTEYTVYDSKGAVKAGSHRTTGYQK